LPHGSYDHHNDNDDDDDLRAARGCVCALLPSLILWLGLIVIGKLMYDQLAIG